MAKRRIYGRQGYSLTSRLKWWLDSKWHRFKEIPLWKKTLIIGGPLIAVTLVVPLAMYLYFSWTMGDMEQLMNRNNTGIVLKDIRGEAFYSTGTAEHRELVPLESIADTVEQAVVASEDRNFYEHSGISFLSTIRAVYGYVLAGGGEFGGSTLTQQLAKMTMLSTDRGFIRQYQAFSVAIAIEQRYEKDEILMMYLNAAYFGNNSFGIEQAARNYFNKSPNDLTLAESAMLIGVLPAPSIYSPVTGDAEKASSRQKEVLNRMVREGMIDEGDKSLALSEQLTYQAPASISNDAPHFTEMVIAELYNQYGEEEVERSGFQVTTTLDMTLQRQAVANINSQIGYIQRMGGSNAGLIAIDPKSGQIRALVGSVDYRNADWGVVNMATTKRQPGSTFKPIYYGAALADGVINPATVIRDEAININGYRPQNATKRYYGDVTVRQALARSLNIPAVKVMQEYGIEKSMEAARKLGITTLDRSADDYGFSLAIGSAEVPLQQMANAYAALANNGNVRTNTTIHAIHSKLNKSIYSHRSKSSIGINAQGAYLVTDILADQNARAFMFGSALNVLGKTVAVKTGTTDDNRDAWAIGYTPDIAIGVWVGNNDNRVMRSGGSDMAGPIWRTTMQQAIGASNPQFARPSGVVERYVCYGSGALANTRGDNTYEEKFLQNALPAEMCNVVEEEEEEEKQPEEEIEAEPVEEEDDEVEPPVDEEEETDDPDEIIEDEEGDDSVTPPVVNPRVVQ